MEAKTNTFPLEICHITGTDSFTKCHITNYPKGIFPVSATYCWVGKNTFGYPRIKKRSCVAKKNKKKINENRAVGLHSFNCTDEIIQKLYWPITWLDMPDENQYCTESCTEFLHRKLYICTIYILSIWKKFSTSTVNMECLTSFAFYHQSTIHSMNTFPVNLTSPNHARFVILIYSTLNSVHRIKSTSSPATQKKKWQQPRFILQWFKFHSVKGHLLYGSSLKP